MNLRFRKANDSDASALVALICDNALQTLAPFYSELQLKAFLLEYSLESMQHKIASQDLYCAMLSGQLAGTVALKNDWVRGVYTGLAFMGRGIGQQMMAFIETIAVQKGMDTLHLAASPLGVSFYEKLGWQTVAKQDFDYNGVMFEETLMQKKVRGRG